MREFGLGRLETVNVEALLIAAGQNVKRLLEFGARNCAGGARAPPYAAITRSGKAFLDRLVPRS